MSALIVVAVAALAAAATGPAPRVQPSAVLPWLVIYGLVAVATTGWALWLFGPRNAVSGRVRRSPLTQGGPLGLGLLLLALLALAVLLEGAWSETDGAPSLAADEVGLVLDDPAGGRAVVRSVGTSLGEDLLAEPPAVTRRREAGEDPVVVMKLRDDVRSLDEPAREQVGAAAEALLDDGSVTGVLSPVPLTRRDPTPDDATSDPGPATPGGAFGVLAALGVVGIIAALFARRLFRRPAREEGAPGLVSPADRGGIDVAVSDAVDRALEIVRDTSDPRVAIIVAYLELEEVSRSVGVDVHPTDTPIEHLDRVSVTLSTSRPSAVRLTALFEQAMFSPHPVGPAERDEAQRALEEIRRDLHARLRAQRLGTEASG